MEIKILKLIITCCLIVLANQSANAVMSTSRPQSIKISIHYSNFEPKDTIRLNLGNTALITQDLNDKVYSATAQTDGVFRFEIPVDTKFGIFRLSKNRRTITNTGKTLYLLPPQFWEAGDSIHLEISFTELLSGPAVVSSAIYSGPGAKKYNVSYQVDTYFENIARPISVEDFTTNKLALDSLKPFSYDKFNNLTVKKLAMLDSSKAYLSELAYNVIKANTIYSAASLVVSSVYMAGYTGKFNGMTSSNKEKTLKRFLVSFDPEANYGLSNESLANSFQFLNFLTGKYGKYSAASRIFSGGPESADWKYRAIKEHKAAPELKEMILLNLLVDPFLVNMPKTFQNYISEVRSIIKDPENLRIVDEKFSYKNKISFLSYSLENVEGAVANLSKFKNTVLLVDFWFTGCGACATLYKNVLSKVQKKYAGNKNFTMLSICVDRNRSQWKKSIPTGRFTTAKGINLYAGMVSGQNPILKDHKIAFFPTVLLINKEGEIVFQNTENIRKEESVYKEIDALLSK